MTGKNLFNKLFKKEVVSKVDLKVELKEDLKEIYKPYKKEEIDLNKIDFRVCPRFQIFLDMVRNE